MYGAFIGDIVGSKYEFANIKTKAFPLFSADSDFTDDTIMTVAVARAIILSQDAQCSGGRDARGFQDILIEVMRSLGARWPFPTGSYGSMFSQWLRQPLPQPYGSFGNGSAMRVSPCGLAAVTLEEALALARASAAVTHNHPEGIKGAEAVAAAVFMAKTGSSKDDIRRFISGRYYVLDFSLDDIRETYSFDGSCQGSVPQAITAFLESETFEDAIRSIVSIGGDCDTTGAIAGSIAWTYYAVSSGGYNGWARGDVSPDMLEIKARAQTYLPEDFIDAADEFHELCRKRADAFARRGTCTAILSEREAALFGAQA